MVLRRLQPREHGRRPEHARRLGPSERRQDLPDQLPLRPLLRQADGPDHGLHDGRRDDLRRPGGARGRAQELHLRQSHLTARHAQDRRDRFRGQHFPDLRRPFGPLRRPLLAPQRPLHRDGRRREHPRVRDFTVDLNNPIDSGGFGSVSGYREFNESKRDAIKASGSFFISTHEIKGGVDFENNLTTSTDIFSGGAQLSKFNCTSAICTGAHASDPFYYEHSFYTLTTDHTKLETGFLPGGNTVNPRAYRLGAFLQDSWKVIPNLPSTSACGTTRRTSAASTAARSSTTGPSTPAETSSRRGARRSS